ncbi:MAG: hypothetical protein AB7S38_15845 [Vulcanimicrobiota bacterium]
MESVLALALGLVVLWITGFLAVRQGLGITDPLVALGLPLPLALLVLLGLGHGLAQLLGQPLGWTLASLAVVALMGWLFSRRKTLAPLSEVGFSPFVWGILMTAMSGAYFIMHTREVSGPEDDYWVHFPIISLLERGNFPPPNPFFYNLDLGGHFGRDYLIAMLTWLSDDIMLSTWTFNHLLSLSLFVLACGLGRLYGQSTAAALFLPMFLFFGISVGSRVGMVDTYDNNNLLVYALLLALLVVLMRAVEAGTYPPFVALGLLLGIYGIVYETHLILVLGCVVLFPWQQQGRKLLGPSLACCALALGLAALLGGPIQDLALRGLGLERRDTVTHADSYQAQTVQVHFPKENFLQICLGPDSYRRRSYVYEGKLFSNLLPPLRDEGYDYAYIFGPRVLLMHWLALYLGFPAGFYLWKRGHRFGLLLWLFAVLAYLAPAVVDFGPVHEKEYFRWEFAAAFGFAGALALALADLFERAPARWQKALLILLAGLVMLGGERRLNKTFIEAEKASPRLAQLYASPFYPSSQRWFVETEVFNLSPDDVAVARWLGANSRPEDRMLVNLDPRAHWDIFAESTIAGLAGMRSIGHQSPPPWMPDGIAPFFRTANPTVFWQELDARALPASGATWLFCRLDGDLGERLATIPGLVEAHRSGQVAAYRYTPPGGASPAQDLSLQELALPDPARLQSEVAYSTPVRLRNDGSQKLEWRGYLSLRQLPLEGTDPGGTIEPLALWVDLELEPGQEKTVDHWLVPPLVEGGYRVEVLADGVPLGEREYRYSFLDQGAQVSLAAVERDRFRLEPDGFKVEGPLRVGWRLYDLEERRYPTPFGFVGTTVWDGGAEWLPYQAVEDAPANRYRLDFFLVSRSGREVHLKDERTKG